MSYYRLIRHIAYNYRQNLETYKFYEAKGLMVKYLFEKFADIICWFDVPLNPGLLCWFFYYDVNINAKSTNAVSNVLHPGRTQKSKWMIWW